MAARAITSRLRFRGLDMAGPESPAAAAHHALRTLSLVREGGGAVQRAIRPPAASIFADDRGRTYATGPGAAVRFATGSAFDGVSGFMPAEALPRTNGAPDPAQLNASPLHDSVLSALSRSFASDSARPAPAASDGPDPVRLAQGTGIPFGAPVPLHNPPINDPAADPTNIAAAHAARRPAHADESFAESLALGTLQQTGAQALAQLAGDGGVTGAFNALTDIGNLISNAGNTAVAGLANMGLAALNQAIFGTASDDDPLSQHLASRFGPQLLTSYGPQLVKDLCATGTPSFIANLSPTPSNASVPVALAKIPGGAGGIVGVCGKAVLRENDTLDMPPFQDAGPMGPGNPAVIVNGAAACGQMHTATGVSKGAVGGPAEVAATVLMGAASGAVAGAADAPSTNAPGSGPGSGSSSGSGSVTGRPVKRDYNTTAAGLNPGWLLESALGMERHTKPGEGEHAGREFENWSILWGAAEIGSPQEPHAGITGALWWFPHRVFGFDMSDYYLKHDVVFDSDRRLTDAGAILTAEADTFVTGLSSDPVKNALQLVYTSATTAAGLTFATINSLDDLFSGRSVDPRPYHPPVVVDREAHDQR